MKKRLEGSTCEPVIQKNDDLKAEGLIMSRSDKEHISTDTKTILSFQCGTGKERIDDIQAGTSVDLYSENSASSINIESSTNIREMEEQALANNVDMEQEVWSVYYLFIIINQRVKAK